MPGGWGVLYLEQLPGPGPNANTFKPRCLNPCLNKSDLIFRGADPMDLAKINTIDFSVVTPAITQTRNRLLEPDCVNYTAACARSEWEHFKHTLPKCK